MIYSPLELALDWLAPAQCLICYEEAEALCISCRDSIPRFESMRCVLCNKFVNNDLICAACMHSSHIDEIYCAGVYDGILKSSITSYKFDSNRVMSKSLASLLGDRLPYFGKNTIISYVPTISPHIRQRGFDHARRLALILAKTRRLPVHQLVSRKASFQQRGSSRKQRQAQAAKSFKATNMDLSGRTVVLVDDVMTSGATLVAVSKLLHQMGAKNIVVAVLAHGQT